MWKDKEAADECTARHAEPDTVVALGYPKYDYGTNQRFPLKVKVTVKMESKLGEWDYAIYELIQIGPKGV